MKTINFTNKLRKATLLLVAFSVSFQLFAASTSWKGTTNTNWNTSTNWTSGVPTSATNVIIGDAYFTGANQPKVNVAASCASLTLGNGTITTTLTITSYALTVSGNVTVGTHGTVTHSSTAIWTIGGAFTNNGTYNATNNSSEILFSGAGTSFTGTGTNTIKKLNIAASSILALSSGTITVRTFTIPSGSTFNQTGGVVKISRDILNSGTYNATAGTIEFTGNSSASNFATGTNKFYHVIVDASIQPFFDANASSVIRVAGNYTNNNISLTTTTNASFIFNGSGSQTITSANSGSTTTFGDVTIAKTGGTLTLGSNISVSGNWTNTGSTFSGSVYSVAFTGVSKTIGGTASSGFGGLTINNGANCTMANSNSCTSFLMAGTTTNTSFNQSSGTTLTVNGSATVNNATGSGIINGWYINTGNATISGNLNIGNGSTTASRFAKVILTTGVLTVQGNIAYSTTQANNCVLDMSGGACTLNFGGNMTISSNQAVLTPGTSSIVNFNGTVAQTITLASSINYYNVYINNSNAAGATLGAAVTSTNIAGNLSIQTGTLSNGGFAIAGAVAKTFSVSNGAAFKLTGTSSMTTGFGTKTFGATSTVQYAGTTQTVAGLTYGHLSLTGSANKTVSGATIVAGNLSTSGSTTLIANAGISVTGDITIGSGSGFTANSYSHSLKGNWSNSGTFTEGTSTVTFNGTSAQTLTGATTFKNLTVNNSAGLTLSNDATVSGTLNFTSGKITTGASKVYMTSTGSVSGAGTGRYVNGNLKKDLPSSAASATFEVGDASTYASVSFPALTLSTGGSLTVTTSSGDHPNLASSNFSASRTVNRRWTITNNGLVLSTGKVTVNFVAGDCDAGLNTANCEIGLWNGSSWSYPTAGTRTATSTQATGINAIGDIQVGERYAAPTLTSISGTSGTIFQTLSVNFNGTNFISGVSSVNVGTGITVNSTTVNSPTSITANITIGATAATGARNFSVTNMPGGGVSANQTFTVNNPAPTLTSISPTTAAPGATTNVTFTGTNFLSGASSVSVGAGITVNSTTVNSSTSITANITISSSATPGTRNFSVTNTSPGGGTSSNQTFTINALAPSLTSISPTSGVLGQTLNVTFTGNNYTTGISSVNVGAGITVNSTTVNSSTSITANITISASATTGTRNFSVTNSGGGGTSATQTFTINTPSPTLTSILPSGGIPGQTLNVNCNGTGFLTGVSSVTVGTGITINSTTVSSSTLITINITIASSASTGARSFYVTNSGGGGSSGTQTFTVNNPVPTLSSISVSNANRLQTFDITFTGTNFISGVTTANMGAGITVNSNTVNSATSLTANVTILGTAATGGRNISVVNSTPGGGTSASAAFTIRNPLPVLTSISPASGNRYQTLDITFTGDQFIPGVTTVSMGAGITVNSTTVNSVTELVANITISSSASIGNRIINASNPIPGGGNTTTQVFTVDAGIKTFGVASGNWNVASNWLPPSVPGSGESVLIPSGTSCTIVNGETENMESVTIGGTLTIDELGILNCNGTLKDSIGGSLVINGAFPTYSILILQGSVEFASPGAQTISDLGTPFVDLKIAGPGTKTLGTDINVSNDVIIEGALDEAGFNMDVQQDWTNNGTFTANNGKVTFSGSSAQTISGSSNTQFYDVSISNTSAAGVSLTSNASLMGTLDLESNAKFNTTGSTFTLVSTATETARIGPVPSDATFTGNIVMQRYIPATAGYRMIGSAITAPPLSEVDDDIQVKGVPGGNCASCYPNFWLYDETVSGAMNVGYVIPSNFTNTIPVGMGVFIKQNTSSPLTLDIAGTPNIGSIAIPVTYTPSTPARPLDDGWFLASNVFPCDIDWESATGWTKTNISTTYYAWDATISDYRYYQAGVGGNGSKNIASTQAFWVKATGSNPTLIVNENAKVTTSGNLYRLNTHIQDAMSLRIIDGSDTTKTDDAYIRFTPTTFDSYEPENDSHRLFSASSLIPNIATLSSDSVLLAINAMSALDHNIIIPVTVRVNTTGSYTIMSPDVSTFPTSTCFTLDDLATGIKTDLRVHGYTCTITASSSSTPRFLLHIAPPVKLDINESTCPDTHDGKVIAKGQANGPWSYKWKLSNGTVIKTTPPTMNPDTLTNLNSGSYIVEVTNASGYCSVVEETFEVNEPDPISGNPSITNVGCFGEKTGTVSLFASGGRPPYQYAWTSGANSSSLEDLSAGTYHVTITDANGCINYGQATVMQPDAIAIAIDATDVGYCTDANGTALARVTGGNSPYSYKWSNNAAGSAIKDLSPGKYSVEVTDNNQCVTTQEISIAKSTAIEVEFTANADTVFVANGGTVAFINKSEGAAEYKWNFGDGSFSTEKNPEHTYEKPGAYDVTLIAGSNQCSDSTLLKLMVLDKEGNDESDMSISPNPNRGDVLNVIFKEVAGSEMMCVVYDEEGRVLLNRSISKSGNKFQIDLTDGGNKKFTPGIYMISAIVGDKSFSKKLVINGRN